MTTTQEMNQQIVNGGYWTRCYGGRKLHFYHKQAPICGTKISSGYYRFPRRNAWVTMGYSKCTACVATLEHIRALAEQIESA